MNRVCHVAIRRAGDAVRSIVSGTGGRDVPEPDATTSGH